MKRRLSVVIIVVIIAFMSVVPALANRGDGAPGVIYATSCAWKPAGRTPRTRLISRPKRTSPAPIRFKNLLP